MITRSLNIGGLPAESDHLAKVNNPATGEVAGTFFSASSKHVDQAVSTAQLHQPQWQATTPAERAKILLRAAELIEANCSSMAETLTLEQGKPFPDSKKEINFGAEVFRYYANMITNLSPDVRRTSDPTISSTVNHLPLGVIGAIVPWNYPVDLWCWKVAPALAAGNAVIVKPPIEAPLASGVIADLLYEAGLPRGVLSDIPGGREVGERLVEHPGINAITATCSTNTGRQIMEKAAPSLKRLVLELGGNCPFIVLEDADIEATARAAMRRSFSNAGQICIAVNRIIVHDSIADQFVDALVELVKSMKVGNGMIPGIEYGPTTTEGVILKSQEHISDAINRGGKLRIGGSRLTGADFDRGNFFASTVIDNVDIRSLLATEETFGPVVGVLRVSNTDDAIRVANDSQYGLAAYVFGGDEDHAIGVGQRLQSGAVGINVNDVTELDAPFGGWKMSGMGRELGREGFFEMTQSQHIRVKHSQK